MRLNTYGEIVREEWSRTAVIRREVELDASVIMPNHLHAIVVIIHPGNVGARRFAYSRAPTSSLSRPAKSLGALVAGFKSAATKNINELRGTPGAPVWQRSFYDRVIRDETRLNQARQYIEANPAQWALDQDNLSNFKR
jgi:REP element-mobilizing transposase RayT